MAKNKITDLHNHLFAQLERLNDETLTAEQQSVEIQKAKAVSGVANAVIQAARLEIDFVKATGTTPTESTFFGPLETGPSPKSLY